jgi:hypothetical protein
MTIVNDFEEDNKIDIKEHPSDYSYNNQIVKLELNKMLFIVEFLLLNKKIDAYILVVDIQIIKLLKTFPII